MESIINEYLHNFYVKGQRIDNQEWVEGYLIVVKGQALIVSVTPQTIVYDCNTSDSAIDHANIFKVDPRNIQKIK